MSVNLSIDLNYAGYEINVFEIYCFLPGYTQSRMSPPPSLFPHASGIDIFVTYSLLISLNSFLYNARNSYAFHVENQLWVFVLKMWFLAF